MSYSSLCDGRAAGRQETCQATGVAVEGDAVSHPTSSPRLGITKRVRWQIFRLKSSTESKRLKGEVQSAAAEFLREHSLTSIRPAMAAAILP